MPSKLIPLNELVDQPDQIEVLLGCVSEYVKGNNVCHTWILKNYPMNPPGYVRKIEQHARAFLLCLIGCIYVPNTSSTVSVGFSNCLADLDEIRAYDWGSAAYVTLFDYMVRFSLCAQSLGGYLLIWDVRNSISNSVACCLFTFRYTLMLCYLLCRYGLVNI